MTQQNHAPRGCRQCGHLESTVVWLRTRPDAEKTKHERCIHPTGPHPMNEFCPWKTPKTEGIAE